MNLWKVKVVLSEGMLVEAIARYRAASIASNARGKRLKGAKATEVLSNFNTRGDEDVRVHYAKIAGPCQFQADCCR
jgi:hypothetical protein